MNFFLSTSFLYKEFPAGRKYKTTGVGLIWFIAAFVTALSEVVRGPLSINNYSIFRGVFFHAIHGKNLYTLYPAEYFDMNHYGILFSLVIAPFAILPYWPGCMLWCMFNAWLLYVAITRLPLPQRSKLIMLAVVLIEMLTATHGTQFNPATTALIILPFILVQQQKEWQAAFFIAAGFLIKIYPIVALVTFLFSPNKLRFACWLICWMALLVMAPMLITSASFVMQSYTDWFHSIADKNIKNVTTSLGLGQNISVHGMIQRIFNLPGLNQLFVLVPAAILNLLPLLRLRQYTSINFRLHYLALCLMAVTIFSSSAESPTFVIAVTGVALWFVLSDSTSRLNRALLAFTFLLTILSPTDIFPGYLKHHVIQPYALKALPCFLVWINNLILLLRNDFTAKSNNHGILNGNETGYMAAGNQKYFYNAP